MYYNGEGVKQSRQTALKWLAKAAEHEELAWKQGDVGKVTSLTSWGEAFLGFWSTLLFLGFWAEQGCGLFSVRIPRWTHNTAQQWVELQRRKNRKNEKEATQRLKAVEKEAKEQAKRRKEAAKRKELNKKVRKDEAEAAKKAKEEKQVAEKARKRRELEEKQAAKELVKQEIAKTSRDMKENIVRLLFVFLKSLLYLTHNKFHF
jgi:flagellar biosynthesis GTPase FlhF